MKRQSMLFTLAAGDNNLMPYWFILALIMYKCSMIVTSSSLNVHFHKTKIRLIKDYNLVFLVNPFLTRTVITE